MPKKKVRAKRTSDESVDPSGAYFADYEKGMTIIGIARKYEKSRNTILKYLRKIPEFKQPGSGNHTKGSNRVIGNVREEETQVISICLSHELKQRLDLAPGRNRTEKIQQAIKQYLDLKVADRPKPKHKNTVKDWKTRAAINSNLVKKLDRTNKKATRYSKIVAAVELFLEST